MNTIIPVTENKIFMRAYRSKKSFVCHAFIIYALKNRKNIKRLGITVGKKCGNSVVRSRSRRIIRVMYRENYDIFPDGYDYIIVARSALSKMKSTSASEILSDNAGDFLKSLQKNYSEKNFRKSETNFRKNNPKNK